LRRKQGCGIKVLQAAVWYANQGQYHPPHPSLPVPDWLPSLKSANHPTNRLRNHAPQFYNALARPQDFL